MIGIVKRENEAEAEVGAEIESQMKIKLKQETKAGADRGMSHILVVMTEIEGHEITHTVDAVEHHNVNITTHQSTVPVQIEILIQSMTAQQT